MSNVKDENAVTLMVLVITIIVLVIIASISINAGQTSLESTRLRNFYLKLEIVQKRVDNIASQNETYIDASGNVVILKETGEQLDNEQREFLKNVLGTEDVSNFKYFTENDLKNLFDLTDIGHNLFIDFENRMIVSADPVTAKGEKHYVLENDTYFINNSNADEKNVGNLGVFTITVEKYGTQRYKIKVTPPSNIGDVRRGRESSI